MLLEDLQSERWEPEAGLPALSIKSQRNLPAPRPSTVSQDVPSKANSASSQLQAGLEDATFQKPILVIPLFSPPTPANDFSSIYVYT